MAENLNHIGVDIAKPVTATDEALARGMLSDKWRARGEYSETVKETETSISIEWKSVNG